MMREVRRAKNWKTLELVMVMGVITASEHRRETFVRENTSIT